MEMICNLFRILEVISQRGSQLRRWSFNLQSGTHVLAGGFAGAKHLAKFHKWISFRSCEMGFGLRNFRSSFRSCKISHSLMRCLQTTITSLFQLQLVHRLKCWTSDLLRFETTYSIHKMDSRKYSKYVLQLLSSWISSC